MGKRIKKFLTCIIISTLLFTNVFTILPGIVEIFSTYAATTDLENQSTETQHPNVEFDAYFSDTMVESGPHSKVQNIDSDASLITKVQSLSGVVSNISLSFKDLNNTTDVNYSIIEQLAEEDYIDNVDTQNKIINYNLIVENGTMGIPVPLRINTSEQYKLEHLNKTTKVILNAIYTDNSGNQTPINHEIKINLAWEGTFEMKLGERIEKYVPYEIDGKKGVLVQVAVVSRLDTEGRYAVLPIKQTAIQTTVPQFAGVKPSSVNITAARTEATNGEDELNSTFNESNWTYNEQTGQITITVNNTEENGYIWAGKGSDEFIITYDYPEEAYNLVDTVYGVSFVSNYNGQIQYYSNDTIKTATVNYNDTINLKEQIGTLSDGKMKKAPMYANSVNTANNYILSYGLIYSLHILDYADNATYKFKFDYDKFEDSQGNTYTSYINNTPYITYKTTKINKQTFERVLGTNGYIRIYDLSNNYLGIINSASSLDSEGYYTFSHSTQTGGVILETSVPINFTDTIIVEHSKEISPRLPYSREQIRTFTKIISIIEYYNKKLTETEYQLKGTSQADMLLEDTISEAYINITNPTIRENETNQNIIFNISLVNNNLENADLFSNPIFQIDLPNHIEDIDIKSVILRNNPQLSIKEYKKIKRADGGYSIKVYVQGQQTIVYQTPTQIRITTDIQAKQYIPNLTEEVKMLYYNEYAIKYETETDEKIEEVPQTVSTIGLATTQIDFVGTNDLICSIKMTNFDDKGTEISSASSQNVGIIEAADQARIARMHLNVINSYNKNCKDIVIIGRIPFQNNKYAISGEDLQSTFSTTLESQITTTNTDLINRMTIYYSENGEATPNLSLQTNGWTTTYTQNNNFKSYLIVIEDYELTTGSELNFNYDFKIPENVAYEKEVYANFGVYYTKEEVEENKETSKIGLKTQEAPRITLQKQVSAGNNATVGEGDIVKYTITVQNVGTVTAKNIILKDTIPAGTTYVEKVNGQYQKNETITEVTKNIATLQAGQSEQMQFEVEIDKITQENTTIQNVATATADGIQTVITSPQTTNPVKQEYVKVRKTSSVDENTYIKEGTNFEYNFQIENISNQELEQVNLTDILPEGITYIQGYIIKNVTNESYTEITEGVTYNEQTRTVNWNIGSLEIEEEIELKLVVKADEITDNSKSKTIVNNATVTAAGGITKTTTDVTNNIANISIELEKEADIEEYRIQEGTDITYTITLTNNSPIVLQNLNITDELSNLLEFKDAYIVGENEQQIKQGVEYNQTSNTVTWEINQIQAESSIKVKVIATIKELTQDEEELNNIATVESDDIETIESNEIEKIAIKENIPIEYDFDLALDKTIKKITVENSSNSYINKYTGSKMEKIDISNKLLNETIITVEYEITVVNQGNLAGYAKKIIDNIPEGMTFNPENNPGWELKNGKLYYTGLENEIINPEETKPISLILKKQMTENNVGSIINTAEIYEDYNVEGEEDINSTPNNQEEKENDFSKAEVFITIKTGEQYIYYELIITSLAILATGIYFIKKKVI